MKYFHHAGRCARNQGLMSEDERSDIYRMEAIDIFLRVYCLQNRVLVDMLGERKLDQDPVDRIVFVQFPYVGTEFFGRDRTWNRQLAAIDPKLFAGLGFHVHVCRRGRIIAHQHDRQPRLNASLPESFNFGGNLPLDVFRDFRPVNECRGHKLIPCPRALHKKSWAVIDRPYSLGFATVGALYERPRYISCAKPCPRERGSHKNRNSSYTDADVFSFD